jgi:predicted alpha/beta superfamily hydrolase
LGRRDGSSLVAKQNRFANYYALSGAWVVSKEDFMQNISWLSSLKLEEVMVFLEILEEFLPRLLTR